MYKNIKPIAKYKKCGRTVTVFMDKDGNKKTIERVDDNRWSVQDYSWLSEMMPIMHMPLVGEHVKREEG